MTQAPLPLLTRIDHVGIACRDLDQTAAHYADCFGLTEVSRETNDEQGVHEVMLQVGSAATGGGRAGGGNYVQLLQPSRPDSPVGRFLERRGEGIHHIGYGVEDVGAALARLGGQDVRLIDQRPRHGSMGAAIAFLHPQDFGGVLIELVQPRA
jgi:methylmalonyl-CoA/ethylmalonyl-CoA epimerase